MDSSQIEVSNIYTNKDFTTGNSGVSYSDIHRQDSINLPQLTHYGTRVCNASYPYPLRSATPKPTITLQETPFKTPVDSPFITPFVTPFITPMNSPYHTLINTPRITLVYLL